jgi:hypothetical protein
MVCFGKCIFVFFDFFFQKLQHREDMHSSRLGLQEFAKTTSEKNWRILTFLLAIEIESQ